MMGVHDGRSGGAAEIQAEATKGVDAAVRGELEAPHAGGHPSGMWATPAQGRKIGLDSESSMEGLLESLTSSKYLSSRVLTWPRVLHHGLEALSWAACFCSSPSVADWWLSLPAHVLSHSCTC